MFARTGSGVLEPRRSEAGEPLLPSLFRSLAEYVCVRIWFPGWDGRG